MKLNDPWVSGYIAELEAELSEWRTGKRRVFWELNIENSAAFCGPGAKGRARSYLSLPIVRVTVGPRGNVRPWRKK